MDTTTGKRVAWSGQYKGILHRIVVSANIAGTSIAVERQSRDAMGEPMWVNLDGYEADQEMGIMHAAVIALSERP